MPTPHHWDIHSHIHKTNKQRWTTMSPLVLLLHGWPTTGQTVRQTDARQMHFAYCNMSEHFFLLWWHTGMLFVSCGTNIHNKTMDIIFIGGLPFDIISLQQNMPFTTYSQYTTTHIYQKIVTNSWYANHASFNGIIRHRVCLLQWSGNKFLY